MDDFKHLRSQGERGARRRAVLLLVVPGLLAVLLAAAYFYDHSRRDVLANGVRVAGIPVGGLNPDQALARLRDRVTTPLQAPIVVSAGGRQFTLAPARANVTIDMRALVDDALRASRRGWLGARVVRGLFGGSVNSNVALRVSFSHDAVRGLIRTVASSVDRSARDATVHPTSATLVTVKSHDGVAVDGTSLARAVEHALAQPRLSRRITAPMRVLHPRVTLSQLAARYPAYIVIDRSAFRLRFYQRLRLASTYGISVGRQGLETPAGLYDVQWKQVDPPWHVPNDSWAGALAGKTIPPGPQDPIKARWMAFNGGAGIHGTSETGSIGHAASHGCVRMLIPDVIALYSRTPVGTPVFVI